jgi:hypothetical protein
MSSAAILLLAAAAAQALPATDGGAPSRDVQLAQARVSVEILRPVVLRKGELSSADGRDTPRAQKLEQGRRVTYEFE